jgi:hypothetical protein
MSTPKQQFLTPVGRLVQGDPFEKQTKNMQGQPLVTQSGQPTQRYFIAVAFSKTQCPEFAQFYALLVQVAQQSFPQLFNAQGQCTHPRFSWKLVDGDGVDDNGKPNNTKDGFAGHWVVKFSSSFPPKCFYAGRYQPHEQIQDPNVIRRGYYVRVSGTIEGNANPQKPGLYVNLSMVELSAQGVEIVSGPDAGAVFGGAPVAALPQGATALPGAQPGAAMPGAMPGMPMAQPGAMPTMPGTQAAMPGLPMPGAMPQPQAPAAMPGAMPGMPAPGAMPQPLPVQPNPAFAAGPAAMPGMPAAMPGAMPGMPQPPAAPVGPQLTPAAQAAAPGFSLQQWQASGWTEQAMRQAGYLV